MAANRTRRTPKKAEDWDGFLAALLANKGQVSHAAQAIGMHRQRAYEHREQDESFAREWDEIVERTTEEMEREAMRRGMEGIDKPVYYQGELVDTLREYSDTLLIFLLKSRRPEKYRDHHQVQHTGLDGGPVNVRVELDEKQREALGDVLRRRPASRSE